MSVQLQLHADISYCVVITITFAIKYHTSFMYYDKPSIFVINISLIYITAIYYYRMMDQNEKLFGVKIISLILVTY